MSTMDKLRHVPLKWSLKLQAVRFIVSNSFQQSLVNYEPGSELLNISGVSYKRDWMTNVSPNISAMVGKNLHLQKNHPLEIIKRKIVSHFHSTYRSRFGGCMFASVDNLSPVVSVEQNFDSLLVPLEHVSRSKNDNYYVNSEYVLRSHTSAHQRDLIKMGWNAFLVTGDVYRRDEIDRSHYPAFHQMEGVRIFNAMDVFAENKEPGLSLFEPRKTSRCQEKQQVHTFDAARFVEFNLKQTLMGVAEFLFGADVETRWVETYFPFTHPSWELEVKLGDNWMEMLGCGVIEHGIMEQAGASDHVGWAFGLGLERFAMKLFDISDIRLFWSEDPRFLSQFQRDEHNVKFRPFSKYPPAFKDLSFWIREMDFSRNDLFEIVRREAGDWVEEMTLVDQFTHPSTGRISHCYRITYRAMDRTLTDEEVNSVQESIRDQVRQRLNVELR